MPKATRAKVDGSGTGWKVMLSMKARNLTTEL